MKISIFLVVLLAAAACSQLLAVSSYNPGMTVTGGFGQIQKVEKHSREWLLAMAIKNMAPEGQQRYHYPLYRPVQYTQQITEGVNYLFKVVITQDGTCMFAEAYVPITERNEFRVLVNQMIYAPCDVNLKQVLLSQ